MAVKIDRIQPAGMNVRMQQGKPAYSHVVTVPEEGTSASELPGRGDWPMITRHVNPRGQNSLLGA